jgi:succinoglycan biosynthesis protein ExoO
MPSPAPLVSVIVASYCGERHIAEALRSILDQTVRDLEIIVVDDASPDASVSVIAQIMAADPRVTLIRSAANAGPAAARNRALDAARGQWLAIVDADDIIAPDRFERLLAAATCLDADIVADDLLLFDASGPTETLFRGAPATPFQMTTELFIGGKGLPTPALPFGYLKPLIRAAALGSRRYSETLRIGEDYDLLLRLLLAGARFHILPEPLYRYRRHAGSISHRLNRATVAAMIAADDRIVAELGPFPAPIATAFARRRRDLALRLKFEQLVATLKARRLAGAATALTADPRLVPLLLRAAREHLTRAPVREPAP